jgi:ADP-heptose:LPS heptosyltransferase
MLNFKHSGATGDIIFSLPTIKAMGGGTLYIHPYDEQRARSIAKLISLQPYIDKVIVSTDIPTDAVDLDLFRNHAGHHENLIHAHFKGQGLQIDESYKDGWLTIPEIIEPFIWDGKYSVINYTTNYMDHNFDWSAEVKYLLTFSERVYFVGYEDEFNIFQEKFNTKALFYKCDFAEAGDLIKYAQMFTGCYSAMATIAQGLGRTLRLVQAPGHTCSTLFVPREKIINV